MSEYQPDWSSSRTKDPERVLSELRAGALTHATDHRVWASQTALDRSRNDHTRSLLEEGREQLIKDLDDVRVERARLHIEKIQLLDTRYTI